MSTMKETYDNHLRTLKATLERIDQENLVQRQPTKAKRTAARNRVRKLKAQFNRWEVDLADDRLITRSKTWYRGVEEVELVKLVADVQREYEDLVREAI